MIYRNPKLLKLAKEAPICFGCGKSNDGTVVACHSDSLSDGKGTGIKASDYRIFFGCSECNRATDNKDLTRDQRRQLFEAAHRKTIGWLFESGHIKII